jgi:small subunit ribosomal protein SAe
MVDLYFYRDPEAEENKDSAGVDEAKVPGADEVGPAAVEQGFAGNADWEVSGGAAGAFAAATNTSGAPAAATWDADASGADWAGGAAPAQAGNQEWAAEPPKDAGVKW